MTENLLISYFPLLRALYICSQCCWEIR